MSPTKQAIKDMSNLAKQICEAKGMDYEQWKYQNDLDLVTSNISFITVGASQNHSTQNNT